MIHHEKQDLSPRRSAPRDSTPRVQERPEQGVPEPRGDRTPKAGRGGDAGRPGAGAPSPVAAYVVVARDRRTAPVQRGDDWRQTSRREWQPVGIRHAVPAAPRTVRTEAACGADIREWHTFWEMPFAPTSGSSCQRCLQVLHRAGVQLKAAAPPPPAEED